MSWTITFVNSAAEAEVERAADDMQMRFARITD